MNLCGETLRERNIFTEYFFPSDLENTFYSEIEKETLSNSDKQKVHKRKMKSPCFLLDLEK